MADSAAERQRRAYAHKRGNHSLCDPARCRAARGGDGAEPEEPAPVPAVPEPDPEKAAGGIEKAVASFVESLGYPDDDPRAILGQVAVQLARRVDESGALPAAVRELRVLLAQIAEVPNGGAGPVDEVRLQRSRRRLDSLIVQQAS